MALIVLGIDGLDWGYVDANRERLPTLTSWPVLSPLSSIFPPDSIPAWTTIFTGVPPAEHGFLDSIDYLDKAPDKAATTAAQGLPGRTFWDTGSREGYRVCVVNPFLAYPAWDVNGVMIAGPVFVDGSASITGTDPATLPSLPQLGGIVTFPTSRTIGPFIEETLSDTREQAEFGLKMLEREQPDLFFINLLTIDRLKHFVWRFVDPDDPTYPGPNQHADAVHRAYALVDDVARRYAELGEVLIVSDHGHARRCTRMVYVDEALRHAGLVHESAGRLRQLSRSYMMERAKKLVLRTAYELGAEEQAYRFGRKLPNRKAIKYSSFSSDSERSIARLSRTFGRNRHSGIDLLVDTPHNRLRVIEVMRSLVDPKTGEGVLDWVKEREEVVSGASVSKYPAILFKLRDGYGVDFGLYGGLFGPDLNHRRISGGHTPTGIVACTAPSGPPESIEGVHDFIVNLLRQYADPARK